LEPEQTVLINGGSSAVGVYAIQLAKAKGARVVATASAKNEALVKRLGADEVFFGVHFHTNRIEIDFVNLVHRLHQGTVSQDPRRQPAFDEVSRYL